MGLNFWRLLWTQSPRSCLAMPFYMLVAAVMTVPLLVYHLFKGRTLSEMAMGQFDGGSDEDDGAAADLPKGDATGGRTEAEWRFLLQDLSDIAIADKDIRPLLTPEQIERRWLGEPPASDEAIAAAEVRLGTPLPASYKAFLKVSNGWNYPIPFIRKLAPVETIGWTRAIEPDLVGAWQEGTEHAAAMYGAGSGMPMTEDDLPKTILINQPDDFDDAANYMLNPAKITNGEMEAWFFSSWNPGAEPYRSFWDLMVGERESFRRLRDDNK